MSEWDQFPEVAQETPQGFDAFPEVGGGRAPAQPTEAPPIGFRSRAAEVWERIRGLGFGEIAAGVAEPVAQTATGTAGTIAGGLAGIAQGVNNAIDVPSPSAPPGMSASHVRPEPRPPQMSAADRVQHVQGAMTYQPRTETGQAVSEAIAYPFEKYDEAIDYVAEMAGEQDDTLGATMAYTAMAALPALLGRRVSKTRGGQQKAPTVQELKREAGELYKRADDAQMGIRAESYNTMLDKVRARLADEGFDASLNPATAAALKRLEQDAGKNLSLKGAEINRRVLNNARATMEKSDARMASQVLDLYDDWMGTLGKRDVLVGDASAASLLPKARDLWSRASKADELDWLVQRAGIRAGQFSGSGFENAIRTEFRQLAMNKKRMRRFSPEEQKAIKRIASGDFAGNTMRAIGRFAGRGPVSAVLTAGAGGVIGGPLGAMGALGIGEVGRQAATAMTKRNVNKASELVRRGPSQE